MKIGYWCKDFREQWNVLELAGMMMERGFCHNIEVGQDETDNDFMLLSDVVLTEKEASELWDAGLEFMDKRTMSGMNLRSIILQLNTLKELEEARDE